jgi:3D-(3,5/4)-trihydroxycyclohexane-1,2-dione acylhydrolase (decyclizing)
LVHIETDPLLTSPSSQSWWDVPVAEVSALRSGKDARARYVAAKIQQQQYF